MKKQSPTNRYKKFYPLIIILGVVTVIVAVLFTWNWYTHYTDKQKFMTLKQDMLTLQAEFNKIDPGWQYSEGCHAKGEKFKQNEASSCGVEMKISRNVDHKQYSQALEASKRFSISRQYDFEDYGRRDHNISLRYISNNDIICTFGTSLQSERQSSGMGCHDSALDFYFPKTQ